MANSERLAEKVIQFISERIRRSDDDTSQMADWLQSTVAFFKDTNQDVLSRVLQLCDYQKASRDDVIIRQGERGDCMYVILSGQVGVYIDPKKSGEDQLEANPATQPHVESSGTTSSRTRRESRHQRSNGQISSPTKTQRQSRDELPTLMSEKHPTMEAIPEGIPLAATVDSEAEESSSPMVLNRLSFGNLVVTMGQGKCIGEIALITNESLRNATIIADEDLHLLVINRLVFDETLRTQHEEEFARRRHFINTHPLFKGWMPRLKQLLEMSLIKEVYPFDGVIVKQRDTYDGLIFLRSGRAKIIVEPPRHKSQYKHIFLEQISITAALLEKRKKREKDSSPKKLGNTTIREEVLVRRRGGYAEAEKRLNHRQIQLCCVEGGEILGDIEATFELSTHCQTVVATEPVEAYLLTVKNMERLINKRNHLIMMDSLKISVATKLANRLERVSENSIPLFSRLLFKMRQPEEQPPVEIPPLRGTKSLPAKDILFQHLLRTFVGHRAALVEPFVPGSVYYREMMKEKARQRRIFREANPQTPNESKQVKRTFKEPSRKPKTEEAIKRMRHKEAFERRKREEIEVIQSFRFQEDQRTEDDCDRLKKVYKLEVPLLTGTALMSLHQQLLEKLQNPDLPIIEDGMSIVQLTATDGIIHKEDTETKNFTEKSVEESTERNVNELREKEVEQLQEKEVEKPSRNSSSIEEPQKSDQRAAEVNYINGNALLAFQLERVKTFLTELEEQSDPGVVTKNRNSAKTIKGSDRKKKVRSARAELESRNLDHHKTDNQLNQSDLEVHSNTERTVLPKNNKNMRKKMKIKLALDEMLERTYENPSYRDWETSETSLRYLEERLAKFTSDTAVEMGLVPVPGKLPKLRRYQIEDGEKLPFKGGKVLVTQRPCLQRVQWVGNRLVNHQHERFHLLPSLPQYDDLRRSKLVMYRMLDNVREQWLQTQH